MSKSEKHCSIPPSQLCVAASLTIHVFTLDSSTETYLCSAVQAPTKSLLCYILPPPRCPTSPPGKPPAWAQPAFPRLTDSTLRLPFRPLLLGKGSVGPRVFTPSSTYAYLLVCSLINYEFLSTQPRPYPPQHLAH